MLTIRIEFFKDQERLELLKDLKKDYEIVSESVIKNTHDSRSKIKIQFLQIVKK